MKIMKTLYISALALTMLCTTAFAAEVEVKSNDPNVVETTQAEIQAKTENKEVESNLTKITEEATVKKGMVTVDILNVRSGPSTETEKSGKLLFGTTVDIQSDTEGWYEINYESSTAYICAEYVRIIDTALTDSENAGINVVEYAKLYLGTPYASGGNTTKGFDCSGYVQYVMANFGITMPRTSTDQYSIGVRVDKSQLMPGDLVYFKYSANSYRLSHVGIYVGDGNFIHSPVPGRTVKISPINTGYFSNYYYGATRVLQ